MLEKLQYEKNLETIKVKDYSTAEQAIVRKLKLESIRKIDNCVKQLRGSSITNQEFDQLLELTNAELDHVYAQNFTNIMAKNAVITALK